MTSLQFAYAYADGKQTVAGWTIVAGHLNFTFSWVKLTCRKLTSTFLTSAMLAVHKQIYLQEKCKFKISSAAI